MRQRAVHVDAQEAARLGAAEGRLCVLQLGEEREASMAASTPFARLQAHARGPGVFSRGTSHFDHAGHPADQARAEAYAKGPYEGVEKAILSGLASLEPADADAASVADVVAAPFGKRPYRVHVDPSQDGAEIVNGVADRVRAEMLRRIGLGDLLSPRQVS